MGTQHKQLSVLNSSSLSPKEWNWISEPLPGNVLLLCQPHKIKPFPFLWISEVLGSILDASFLVPPLEKWGALRASTTGSADLPTLAALTLVCKVTYTIAPRASWGKEANCGLGLFLCWKTTYALQEWSIFGILREKQNHHQQDAQDWLLRGAADIHSTHWDQRGKRCHNEPWASSWVPRWGLREGERL